MIQRMLVLAAMLLASGAMALGGPLGDGFAGRDLSTYLENAKQLKPAQAALVPAREIKGKQVLRLGQGAQAVFKAVPVQANTKYTLTFRARYEGGEAVEENPRLDIFAGPESLAILPGREVRFFDAQKKPLPGFRSGIIFRAWHDYRDIFYAPDQAAFMQLVVKSGRAEITLFLDDVKLEKMADEGSINVNPVVGQYGPYNYSGWSNLAAGGKIIQLDDGRIVLDSKYGTSGTNFPLHEPGTYRLTAKSTSSGEYNAVIVLRCYDAAGKKLNEIGRRGFDAPYYFVLPAGTHHGSFLVYSQLVEEVRLVRMGDEKMIDELRKQQEKK